MRVSWIAISNLFACYSLIHLDFSIVLSITLELNWSILGLCCDMTVCKLWNIIIYNSLSGPGFMSRNYISGANWICFDDPFIYDWAFSELRQSLWSPSIAWLVPACSWSPTLTCQQINILSTRYNLLGAACGACNPPATGACYPRQGSVTLDRGHCMPVSVIDWVLCFTIKVLHVFKPLFDR
jgi:hypothetical protein